jgi:hypothetical protein
MKNTHDSRVKRGYFGVGLHMPKNNLNVGSAMRAVGAYSGDFMAIS